MFQTEINHFFQSFASDGLTSFMVFITTLGYMEFFLLFLIILLLAVDFKKTFLLFLVLLWTGAITFFSKEYFNLPRPFHVDNTIQLLDGQLRDKTNFEFIKRGAASFWAALPADVLSVTRQAHDVQNGFPSGHSSIAIAFWASLALLFRKKWLTAICVVLILLIPLSRIYLGVHFLADVLGGVSLGVIILAIFYFLILEPTKLTAFVEKDRHAIGFNGLTLILLLPPLLWMFILEERIFALLAFMLGIGLGFLLLAQKGIPSMDGTIGQKIGRTVIGLLIFGGLRFSMALIGKQLGLDDMLWFDFFKDAVAGLGLIWIGTEVSIRLGWFKRI